MACVNDNYEGVWCDVGTNGRVSDEGVINNIRFFEKIDKRTLNIPRDEACSGGITELPYVFMGVEPFALWTDFLKTYSQNKLTFQTRFFNYRLSIPMRIAEMFLPFCPVGS